MTPTPTPVEALYWRAADNGRAACELCPRACVIAEGKSGVCRLRTVRQGKLYASAYGECTQLCVDPIEKKPLYHFHPGDAVLSTGPNGCNLSCRGCQNSDISQKSAPVKYYGPGDLVAAARRERAPGIAYTYTEPLVWFEYVRDAARAAREAGIYNVVVTNGYLEEKPAREIAPLLDAANVDIKSLSSDFYRTYCDGSLEPVLKTCEIFKKHLHLEITNLLVTGASDGEDNVGALVRWVAEHLGRDTPVHFSRYFPRYRYEAPATPLHHLLRAKEIGDRELDYVYLGNAQDIGGADTMCPSCGHTLIERSAYVPRLTCLNGNACGNCGYRINIVL